LCPFFENKTPAQKRIPGYQPLSASAPSTQSGVNK
jgi:hypothetical protein